MSRVMRDIGVMCQALAYFYPGEWRRTASDRVLGSCQWKAKTWRDGHPVCGVHRNASTIQYQETERYSEAIKRAFR